jgi:hypothetical protein
MQTGQRLSLLWHIAAPWHRGIEQIAFRWNDLNG